MKRRSARPFSVEVKHTRVSVSPRTDGVARSRKTQDLWRGQSLVVDDEPRDERPAVTAPAVVRSEAPARRVLPSLVPTFAMPSELEGFEIEAAPVIERLPRVRRPKPAHKPVTEAVGVRPVPASALPADAAEAVASAPRPISGRLARASAHKARHAPGLRPGERWKRRLPQVLR